MVSTSLFEAIRAGNLKATRKFLLEGEKGLDVTIKIYGQERTPLSVACEFAKVQIVEFLIHERNANVNAVSKDGWTPLHYTCSFEVAETEDAAAVAELLLEHGARVNARNRFNGETALHKACFNGHNILVSLLLNYGADINAQDRSGETPLYHACYYGPPDIDLIELLSANNADRTITNICGDGPIDKLREGGHEGVLESYEKLSLAAPGEFLGDSQHAVTCKKNTKGTQCGELMAVRLNPLLSQNQRVLALKAFYLVRKLPVHEVACEILGFLNPASVEKIFFPTDAWV